MVQPAVQPTLHRRVNALTIALTWAVAAYTVGTALDVAALCYLGWLTVTLGLAGWVLTDPRQ